MVASKIQSPYLPLTLRPARSTLADPRGRGMDHLNRYSYTGQAFFNPRSAWNTPISAAARVDPKSDDIMATTVDSDGHGRRLGWQIVDRKGFSISFDDPLYSGFSPLIWFADETVPAVPVYQRYDYPGPVPFTTQHPGSPIRIPDMATSATGSDGQMAVWDQSNRTLYEFWRITRVPPFAVVPPASAGYFPDDLPHTVAPGWYAGSCHYWSDYDPRPDRILYGHGDEIDSGLGYRDYARPGGMWTAPGEFHPAGNAYGGSQSAGLILYSEMVQGYIPHALRYTVLTPTNHHYAQGLGIDGISANVGSCCDGDIVSGAAGAIATYGAHLIHDTAHQVPMGSRIRIKASVDVAERASHADIPRAATIIGSCLQTYGAFLVDRGGQTAIQAETVAGKQIAWAGSGLLGKWTPSVFLPSDFEVMSLPASYGTRAVEAPEWVVL